MSFELWILLGMCVYGSLQALVTGPVEPVRQIHRNFSETFYLFAACVVALHWLGGFGPWSQKGAAVYSAGRFLYLIFSVPQLRPFRRWTWAVSIAGIVGCVAELVRFLLTVHE
jgi:uncharacterized MAPEG superfamily protein